MLFGINLVRDVEYTGPRGVDVGGAILSVIGMGGVVLGILVWQEGGESVAAIIAAGCVALGSLVWWLRKRKREGKPTLLDPDLFRSKMFVLGASSSTLQQVALGALMIVLPIFLQMVLEYSAMGSGLSIAPLSLTTFVVALLAGKRAGRRRPAGLVRRGLRPADGRGRHASSWWSRTPSRGWWFTIPLVFAGAGLGLLVSQLNNYTLAPISEERVSEAAGVNSATSSFGLSFGLAFAGAIMLATLSFAFTTMADDSTVLEPSEKAQVSTVLEDDAEVMSNTQLVELLEGQPKDVQAEILRINEDARPIAMQVALLVPLIAALIGLVLSFGMMKLPDPKSSTATEGMALG